MFAAVMADGVPAGTLIEVAAGFTPRFQVLGRLVLLDVHGVSRLFGEARALAHTLHDAVARRAGVPADGSGTPAVKVAGPGPVRVSLSLSATAAMLAALAHRGITVIDPGRESAVLAPLPLEVLVAFAHLWLAPGAGRARHGVAGGSPEPAGETVPADAPIGPAGWRHPRDTHQAAHTRRPGGRAGTRAREDERVVAVMAATFRRWGVHTLGAVAALPPGEIHARLGARGEAWRRWAAGQDEALLVPWAAEPLFEAAMDLEWPVEDLEPLAFVLARLFDPLAVRLEQADRSAAAIHTALHLVTRVVHLRTIPLPAPLRDPKTLRTLVRLDLESHPPPAAVDRVHVVLDPTPARVLQWTLFERARPAPEQVATLLARLTALVGDGHVGAPAVKDTWQSGAFRVERWAEGAPCVREPAPDTRGGRGRAGGDRAAAGTGREATLPLAFRRFRLPIPVRVCVEEGRPVRVTTDRRGLTGGRIIQAAGPWRTSGAWWTADPDPAAARSVPGGGVARRPPGTTAPPAAAASDRLPSVWDRDEWDIAMADGTVYRLSVERSVGQWFLEGIVD